MQDDTRPTLFCLHFLGGSARSWAPLARQLAPALRCVAIDLPGFGDAAATPGYTVAEMADHVAAAIRAEAPPRWLLAGHSMGAKIAAVLARRHEDGEPGLAGLHRLILLAGSPPGPEPMAESRRQTMLGWAVGDAPPNPDQAARFIDEAAGPSLDPALRAGAIEDVGRAHPAAWRAWLALGSREDWTARIGILRTPALVLAGAEDADLGPDAQARLVARHVAYATPATLPGAGHLLPLEQPEAVARLILRHLAAPAAPPIDPAYLALIASDRVSARTRALLLERARPDDPDDQPQALTPAAFATLRAVLDRVIPQPAPAIDLAARLDAQLAGDGDGWRYDRLPPDRDAYAAALLTLDAAAATAYGQPFASLPEAARDALLHAAAAGELTTADAPLDPAGIKLWFEELRGDAVRLYMAHPATLARLGYSGIAYGGDGEPKSGFSQLGLGQREPWEPLAVAAAQ